MPEENLDEAKKTSVKLGPWSVQIGLFSILLRKNIPMETCKSLFAKKGGNIFNLNSKYL